jgi:hypothetical protein
MKYIVTVYLDDGDTFFKTDTDDVDETLKTIDMVLTPDNKLAIKRMNDDFKALRILIEERCECCGKINVIREYREFL